MVLERDVTAPVTALSFYGNGGRSPFIKRKEQSLVEIVILSGE